MDLKEKRAAIEKRREESAKARAERDERDEVEAIEAGHLDDDENVVMRFPKAREDLSGIVVLRPIKPIEMSRVRTVMMANDAKPGAAESKAKLNKEIANNCLVFPSKEKFLALCSAYADVEDECAGAVLNAARAGATREGKG
jgi:hypothetical protein